MIDVDIELSVSDGQRRFDLSARFATDAPFAVLYGPSGSGKTLTLQTIAGLLKPRAGHVRVGGRTLVDVRAGINVPVPDRGLGYLFQNYALFPHLSVRDNISFGLQSWHQKRLSAEGQEQVRSLLEAFDLTSMASSRPASLSGGQQQRVALARALACSPQVLLLDEPFASLNAMLRRSLRKDLSEIVGQRRIPALMITHDIDDVLALADVVFIYEHGRVIRSVDLRGSGSGMSTTATVDAEAGPELQALKLLLLGDAVTVP